MRSDRGERGGRGGPGPTLCARRWLSPRAAL